MALLEIRDRVEGYTHSGCGDVRDIGSNTGSVDNIVEGELRDEGGGLEEEGEWLSDTTGRTSNDYKTVSSVNVVWE